MRLCISAENRGRRISERRSAAVGSKGTAGGQQVQQALRRQFFLLFLGKRTRDFAFVSLRYKRSGEEICEEYAMATSGRMQYDYKLTNKHFGYKLKVKARSKRPIPITNVKSLATRFYRPKWGHAPTGCF